MKKNTGLKSFIIILQIILLLVGVALCVLGGNSQNFALVALGVILFFVAFVCLIYVIAKYNQYIKYSNKVKESMALIDIHLKLRFDLIPNLVSVVKAYAKHESETFEKIAEIRSKAIETENEKDKISYANKLIPQMKNIFALAENYPELQAQKQYKKLMDELVECEDKIVASRRIYDSNVNYFNTMLQSFPGNIVGHCFGFEAYTLYKIDTAEKIIPTVN